MPFIYLILSIYFGRKNPLYYLIFPIALAQGPGAFIDERTTLINYSLFDVNKNIFKDITIVYLAMVVFYLRKRVNFNLLAKGPFKIYFLYISTLTIVTFIRDGLAYDGLNMSRVFYHMVSGYFFLLVIFSAANREKFISFLNTLFWINGVLSIAYVLNSAKILPIFYTEALYLEVDFGNASFYRDFFTIPFFSGFLFILAFANIILNKNVFNKWAIYLTAVTFPMVLLFTFTRSMLTAAMVEVIIVIIIVFLHKPQELFRSTFLLICIGGIIILPLFKLIFPDQMGYFNDRINSAVSEGKSDENVAIRIAYHVGAYNILTREKSLLFGSGLNKRFYSEMDLIGAWTADSTIPYFIIHSGIIGVLLFYYIGLYYVIKAWKTIRLCMDPISIALFSYVTFSMVSSTFMGGDALGSTLMFIYYVLIYNNYILNFGNETFSDHNNTIVQSR